MDQVNGECEEFFLLADADRDCLLFEKWREESKSCVLSLVTGFPASQASWQRENEGTEEERRGLREWKWEWGRFFLPCLASLP